MQTNLPDFKQLLTDWYLLTLENPLYAGALVISAWLLTVFFYSIRLFFIKRKQRITDQASIKLQNQLDEAQQDNKQSEEKLTAITEELTKEQQLSSEFSLKVTDRNQKIVENIKQLAVQFNLSEQLVASEKQPKSEFVWQQQDNIQLQLTERLQAATQEKNTLQDTYNQEKDQFSKQNAEFSQLQKTLDLQISKSKQLEQDMKVQKHLQLQLKNEAEQIMADKLLAIQEKHDLEVSALGDVEETSNIIDEAIMPAVRAVKETVVTQVEEPELVVNKGDFVASQQAVFNEVVEQNEIRVSPSREVEEKGIEPDYTKSNLDMSGKFKSLFGKSKKQVVSPEEPLDQPEILVPKVTTPDIEEMINEKRTNLDISGKFKSLFGKGKKQVEKLDPEVLLPIEEEGLTEKQTETTGKFKNPFTKSKQQVDPVVAEPEIEVPNEEEQDSEEQVYEPDYAKSNFQVLGKLKKLFGKH